MAIKYFARVDVPDWEIIVKQLRKFIYEQTDLTTTDKPFLNILELEQVKAHVPLLFESLDKINLPEVEYIGVTLVVSGPGKEHTTPHSDDLPKCVRLNFPIENCEGTYTVFYKNLKPSKGGLMTNGIPYGRYYLDECQEVGRLEMTSPAMVMVNVPHMVYRESKVDPRLLVTVGFVKDPWHVLQD